MRYSLSLTAPVLETFSTEVASVRVNGVSQEIEVSSLGSARAYTLKAVATDPTGHTSNCPNAGASYTLNSLF